MRTTATITGNTYPARDTIKDLGGRWDPATKTWTVDIPTANPKLNRRTLVALERLDYDGRTVTYSE